MTKPIQIKNLMIGSGIPKICVPLTGTTKEKICQEAEAAKKAAADLVEWRADFFEGLLDPEACRKVLEDLAEILGETPLLFTIRTSEEGGNIAISLEDYKACNLNAAKSGKADLVDVEVMGNPQEKATLVADLQKEGTKVIASSHDFHKTDSQEILLNRFREMEKSGADILKMAVMPHGFEDVAAIMEATNAMRQECEKPLVSMAMGSIGSITRISGENFGSGITFGTVGAASAPGQFPIGELRSLLEALHRKNEEDECCCEKSEQ